MSSFVMTHTASPSSLSTRPLGRGRGTEREAIRDLPHPTTPVARGRRTWAMPGSTLRTKVANSNADESCSTVFGSAGPASGDSMRHDASASRSTSRARTSFSAPFVISMRETSSRRNAGSTFFGRLPRSASVMVPRSTQSHTPRTTATSASTIEVSPTQLRLHFRFAFRLRRRRDEECRERPR